MSTGKEPSASYSEERTLKKGGFNSPIQPLSSDLPFACVPGSYGSATETEQSNPFCSGPCPGGTFCPTDAVTTPIPCPRGNYCPPGSSVPRLCPSATFGNATELRSVQECTPCPVGHACAAGATLPTPCGAGSYSDKPSDSCTLVPPGAYQDQAGKDAFKLCPRGSYCPPGSSVPRLCPSATFSNSTGLPSARECTPCPLGHACAAGATIPKPCGAGSYSDEPSDSCKLVPPGGYQDQASKDGYLPCPPGSFCPEGSRLPIACAVGSFSEAYNLSSSDGCQDAPAGFFAAAGAAAPSRCFAGRFGSASRLPDGQCEGACAVGHYCPSGSTNATAHACPAGTYNSFNGGQSVGACAACPSGLFSASAGSSACIECDAGSVSAGAGTSRCALCREGQYQPLRGMSECRICEKGTSSLQGAAICTVCDVGYMKNSSLDTGEACTDCSAIDGTTCPWNTTRATLGIREGYWRHSENTKVTYECRTGDNSWTPCIGGSDAGADGDGYCASGYQGPVCEVSCCA
eukprot:4158412-Pleurochrysis_carterae.AAC.5